MKPKPLSTNRCSVSLGYQFDYVQALAAKLGIDDTSQAVAVIILDHIRLIGLHGAPAPSTAAPIIPTVEREEASVDRSLPLGENLLAGLLPT